MLHGAFEDTTPPALLIIDETEKWGVHAEEGIDEDDLLKFDGVCNENAQRFRKTKTVEITMAIDPDIAPDEAESTEDEKALEPGGPPD